MFQQRFSQILVILIIEQADSKLVRLLEINTKFDIFAHWKIHYIINIMQIIGLSCHKGKLKTRCEIHK